MKEITPTKYLAGCVLVVVLVVGGCSAACNAYTDGLEDRNRQWLEEQWSKDPTVNPELRGKEPWVRRTNDG